MLLGYDKGRRSRGNIAAEELLRLTAEKERCEAELEDLMARWEEAAQALEQG